MLPTATEREALHPCIREDVELLRRGVHYRLVAMRPPPWGARPSSST